MAVDRGDQVTEYIEFDYDEICFQSPLPSNGIQHRVRSLLENEWVCFAPGYPAWSSIVNHSPSIEVTT